MELFLFTSATLHLARRMASSAWISCTKKPEGYAVLSIHREPVNAFDLDLWQQLDKHIRQLENDDTSSSLCT